MLLRVDGIHRQGEDRTLVVIGYDALPMAREADAALAERLLARDEDALRSAIDSFGDIVYGMARRIVVDPNLAEEVAQDTFLALWRRPGAFDAARGSLQAFLAGIARNKAIDLVRKEESLRRTKDSLLAEAEKASEEVVLNEQFEERQEVLAALRELTQVQREAIVLAYYGGRTYREVAVELAIPEGTAKTRLRDGLIRLRELIPSDRGPGR
jgi:RNA polymerase sigma-70 factor (ECF subfamily)